MAGKITNQKLDQAVITATANLTAFDKALDVANRPYTNYATLCDSVCKEATAFERTCLHAPDDITAAEPASAIASIHQTNSTLSGALSTSRLEFNANRYQREAQYNQVLAELYEVQVRREGFLSDRHRERSKEFFYGMLGAQAGVTIATFSLAVKRKSLLWGLAATAGLLAVSFAAYVYLFV
jgi:hypothetical protein